MIIPFDRDERDEWPVIDGIHCEHPWYLSESGHDFFIPNTEKAVLRNGRTRQALSYQERCYLKKLKLSKEGP